MADQFTDMVLGPPFALAVQLAHVLTNDAKTKQLHATDKEQRQEYGRPTGYGVVGK